VRVHPEEIPLDPEIFGIEGHPEGHPELTLRALVIALPFFPAPSDKFAFDKENRP
jgi:hypothetical protein